MGSWRDKPKELWVIWRLSFLFNLLFSELPLGFMPETLLLAFGFSRGFPQLMGALPCFLSVDHLAPPLAGHQARSSIVIGSSKNQRVGGGRTSSLRRRSEPGRVEPVHHAGGHLHFANYCMMLEASHHRPSQERRKHKARRRRIPHGRLWLGGDTWGLFCNELSRSI
jgi:hypothetical protein